MFVYILIALIIIIILWLCYTQSQQPEPNYKENYDQPIYQPVVSHHPRFSVQNINEDDYTPVSSLQLMSDPSKYNNMLITVDGVYSREHDASVAANETLQPLDIFPFILAYSKSLLDNSIWMEATPDMIVKGNPRELYSKEPSKYNVTAYGKFMREHTGYGPNGQYGSRIILDKIIYHERIE